MISSPSRSDGSNFPNFNKIFSGGKKSSNNPDSDRASLLTKNDRKYF